MSLWNISFQKYRGPGTTLICVAVAGIVLETISMENNQSGFTLIEIAIVLVIVSLLLATLLKGRV